MSEGSNQPGGDHALVTELAPPAQARIAYLRAVAEMMRDVGMMELVDGDLHVKLGFRPRVERPLAKDADEAKELAEVAEAEQKMTAEERAHYRKWGRVVRSSGAPIPPYKAPERQDA